LREYVTLFDSNFLPRGLALYRSLARHSPAFRLRVLCLDPDTATALEQLALPGLEAIPLSELEDAHPELLAVKPGRSRTEYFWTLTPASALYVFEREADVLEITYLDADLMFFADPEPIFAEMRGCSILITPHRYAPRLKRLEGTMGRYNVQFVTFRRDERGLEALRWWHERCVEWCFRRAIDGRFGDQKYLDDWPDRFAGVHVLEHPGGGLAPWNVSQHSLARRGAGVEVDGRELVFFHYHGLHRTQDARGQLHWRREYPVSATEEELIWRPYIAEVERATDEVRPLLPEAMLGIEPFQLVASARRASRRIVPLAVRQLLDHAVARTARYRPPAPLEYANVVAGVLEETERR
jgi:hypothetical protein